MSRRSISGRCFILNDLILVLMENIQCQKQLLSQTTWLTCCIWTEFIDKSSSEDRKKDLALVVVSVNKKYYFIDNLFMVTTDDSRMTFLPHCSAKFLVSHPRILFPLTPQLGYLVWLDKLEDAILPSFPSNKTWVCHGIQQEVTNKLPELSVSFPYKDINISMSIAH